MIYNTDIEYNDNTYIVNINKKTLGEAIEFQSNNNFIGQKVHHPFKTEKRQFKIRKHMQDTLVYTNEFIDEETKNIILNSEFYVKHDGSCGYVRYDGTSFKPYARYDIKKKGGKFGVPKDDWISCEPMPQSDEATHWPHFVKCEGNLYKWQNAAFDKAINKLEQVKNKRSFTVEFMGKKFNGNKTDVIEDDGVVVPHCSLEIIINKDLISYEGFKTIFEKIPSIEGVIAYGSKDGKKYVYKIRRDMFYSNNTKFEWPNQHVCDFSNQVAL